MFCCATLMLARLYSRYLVGEMSTVIEFAGIQRNLMRENKNSGNKKSWKKNKEEDKRKGTNEGQSRFCRQ